MKLDFREFSLTPQIKVKKRPPGEGADHEEVLPGEARHAPLVPVIVEQLHGQHRAALLVRAVVELQQGIT